MDPVRLPHYCALNQEGESWILRWREEAIGLEVTDQSSSRGQARIGNAIGPDAITESDARRLARRYLLSHLSPSIKARRATITVSEFIETHFLPEFVAAKTLAGRAHYHSILKHILSPEELGRIFGGSFGNGNGNLTRRPGWPYLSNLRIRDTRPHHVEQLLTAATASGYSPLTVRRIRSVVSALFSFAKRELIFMGTNPARSVKGPDPVRKSTPALTLSQMEQIIRAMRYPEKEMTLFALLADMNVSEICGLQWKNVNLTGMRVDSHDESIPPLTIAVKNRLYRGELANAKDTRRRMIHIPETLLPMLLLLHCSTRYCEPDDFVLTSRSGAAINVTNITARRLGVIGKKLEIPELTWQLLRRAQSALKKSYGAQFQYYVAAAAVAESQPEEPLTVGGSKRSKAVVCC